MFVIQRFCICAFASLTTLVCDAGVDTPVLTGLSVAVCGTRQSPCSQRRDPCLRCTPADAQVPKHPLCSLLAAVSLALLSQC